MNLVLDEKEKQILAAMQNELSLSQRPFLEIADTTGLTEDEVISAVKNFKDNGTIRKIGAVLNPKPMGYVSLLAAANVPEDRIDEVADIINSYHGVTHNYLREGEPNIWFTLTEENPDTLKKNLKEIEERTGIKVTKLPMTKKYKIGVKLDI